MGAQFGKWNFDGTAPCKEYIDKAVGMLLSYGPDGDGCYSKAGMHIEHRALHITSESRREMQPYISNSGQIFTWDGRLDNRNELIEDLAGAHLSAASPDVLIAAAAYQQWQRNCFGRLIGDWVISIWDPRERFLLLAKDAIGTRHLFYEHGSFQVTWSTILDPLVRLASSAHALNEEYLAGCFSFFPACHLTPYVGIHSLPPGSWGCFRNSTLSLEKYWDFDPSKKIRYGRDADYEEHFRSVFSSAVSRRLRADTPILAELSGGVDSSSIVCVADQVMREATSGTARLDTISYYNNSEANWDEKPYFTKVEEKRGRTGTHIDVGHNVEQSLSLDLDVQFSVVPGGSGRLPSEVVERMASQGTRVVLSGIGGDEVTGGVPTPIPELADLLATANFQTLAHQLKVWALNNRRPWLHLLLDTLREFFPAFLVGIPRYKQPASWLQPAFIKRNRRTFTGYETQLNLMGPRPSFQENMNTFRGLQRQLGCEMPIANPVHERRYPYLDRDLLEFLFAIPREQLVRPGQRRSLMRRALSNIVPHEVLNRKRKAYVARTPYASIAAQWQDLNGMTQNLISSSLRLVDKEKFIQGLLAARDGREMPIVLVMRTILIESWLKSHQTWIRSNSSLAAQSLSAPAHSQRDDTSKVERPSMALERVSGLPYLAARTNLS